MDKQCEVCKSKARANSLCDKCTHWVRAVKRYNSTLLREEYAPNYPRPESRKS